VVLVAVLGIGFSWFRQQEPSGRVEEKMYDVILQQMLSHSVPEMSVADLASSKEKMVLLDSRSEDEYQVSHLPGAIWIGDNAAMQLAKMAELSKDDTYIVYCSVGLRSEQAASRMQDAGYKATNLYGGLFEWSNQQKPLVGGKEEPTKAVHGYSMIWAKWIRNGDVVLP
jgi:rhodanese-related sulfurtransferase